NLWEGSRSSRTARLSSAKSPRLLSLCRGRLQCSPANPPNAKQSLWHGRAIRPLKFVEVRLPGFRRFFVPDEDPQLFASRQNRACRSEKPETEGRVSAR